MLRTSNATLKAIETGEQILSHPEKHAPKNQLNFYYHPATLCEENHQDEKAADTY